jgi:LuxR family maltose regulon positive regulatory protein
MAGPLTGLSLSAGLELSGEAVKAADDHGWSEDPVIVTALATGAMALLWLGRLGESERWLDRAQRTLQPEGEPGTELIVHQVRGLLRLSQGRLDEALAALRAAERMQAMLAGTHAFSAAVQARLLQTQVYMGRLPAARAALAEISEEDRDKGDMRLAAAAVHLAEGEADQAIDALAAVIDGSAPVIHRPTATTEAHVLDARARDQLGDRRAAEASLERALDAAEPEGIVLPFVLAPVRDLLERLPPHRTAHPTLRRTILDVLDGEAPRATGSPAGSLDDELSEAELRVVRYLPSNLRAPEIASELFVSTNTIRTHLRHIYAKLDVHGRAEAVTRARELGLLAPSHRSR